MRRTGLMALAFSLLLATAACGGEEEAPEDTPPENPDVDEEV
ncbi:MULTISPECIES: hypothetical protein [Sinobaca]|uniref:Uncharacterized protein n=1 Tax=Sinobaca qinghaiensis TaxID=342944 RepID=A0A419V5V5_9BACL|nr:MULTISPECIES: hypothetical protein [Sinobaca]RKD75296.1 hypothetical protein ATL39_0995 [Sinobaca qinghaiensis]